MRRRGPLAVGAFGLLIATGVVYWWTPEPHVSHSSALSAVFDARWSVAGARVLIGVAMVNVVLSIGVRVKQRQWVHSAGPLVTDSGPAQAIADSQLDLEQQLKQAKRTIDDLTDRLNRSLEAGQAPVDTRQGSEGRA